MSTEQQSGSETVSQTELLLAAESDKSTDLQTRLNAAEALNEKITRDRNYQKARADYFQREASRVYILLGLEQAQHQLAEKDKYEDELTRLLNRRGFFFEVRKSLNFGQKGSLIIIDANKFKPINDELGHDVGDIALKALTAKIQELFSEALVGRLGGDEFIVFIPSQLEQVQAILPKDKAGEPQVSTVFKFEKEGKEREMECTASVGMAYLDDELRLGEACKEADENMFASKQRSGNGGR